MKRRRAEGEPRKVVLVGDDSEADELVTMLQHSKELGYDVVGRVSDEHPIDGQALTPSHRLPYLGDTKEAVLSTSCAPPVPAASSSPPPGSRSRAPTAWSTT